MGDFTWWPAGSAFSAGAAGAAAAGAGAAAVAGACCIICGAAIIMVVWPGMLRLMRTDSSPSVISISAMPDSSSSSMSFLTLRISMVHPVGKVRVVKGKALVLALGRRRDLLQAAHRCDQGQLVTQGAA